jgi:hypothetical protein
VFSAGKRMKRYVRDDAMAMCQIVARTLKEGNEGSAYEQAITMLLTEVDHILSLYIKLTAK